MGGGGGTNTIEKDSTPWIQQQPYLMDVMKQAQQQYKSATPQYYPGNAVAPLSPETQQAQQQLTGYATGAGADFANAATGAGTFNLTAGRDVATNPYLRSAISSAIQPAYDRLQDPGGLLANIRSGSVAAGGYGGSRQGIAEGLAISRTNRDAMGVASELASRGYETGMDNATKTLALSPQIQQAGAQPSNMLDAVGMQKRDFAQSLINEAMQKWQFEQNSPSQKLAQYQQLITGNLGGQTNTTSPGVRANPVLAAGGGALAGYAMGSMIGGAANGAVYGPYGAAAGAIIGLLASQ